MKRTLTDRDIAAQIHDVTLREQGASYLFGSGWLGTPDDPTYVVGGIIPARVVSLAGFSPNDVTAQIREARKYGADGVGTWVHEGSVYVDAIEIWRFEPSALSVARARGEKAIWAAHLGEEISTAEPVDEQDA